MIRSAALPTALAALSLLAACNQPAPSTADPKMDAPATAPAPTPPPASTSTMAHITAEGWGPLKIGMTRAEVVVALGDDANPGAVGGADPEACDEFRPARAPESVLVMIEGGKLSRVSLIRASDITTAEGYGVGDPGAGIKAALGSRAVVTPHKYEAAPAEYITVWSTGGGAGYVQNPAARGIVYEVGSNGAVKAIRAGGPSIQLVEGCS